MTPQSKPEHTPGPLTVERSGQGPPFDPSDARYLVKKNAAWTALVAKQSDAYLYAAAPALREALEAALPILKKCASDYANEHMDGVAQMAEAALRAAKGGE